MRVTTIVWFVAAGGGVLAFLWLVGLPFRLALDALAGFQVRPTRAVATPLFGLFAVTIGSWYVLQAGHSVSKLPIALGVVAIAASAALIVIRSQAALRDDFVTVRREDDSGLSLTRHSVINSSQSRSVRWWVKLLRLRPPPRPRPFDRGRVQDGLRQLSTAVAVFALNMVMSLFTLGAVYAKGRQTVLVYSNTPGLPGNLDIANYASEAQHLLEGGFRRPGPVVGLNMAHEGKRLGYGADALLANMASLLRTDVVHVLHLAMLMATFLGVYGLVRLLNERLGVSRPLAIIAAQAAYAVFFVAYLQGLFFLSQLLAMALLPAFLTLLIDVARTDSWRSWGAGVLGIGLLSATGIALYPPVALVAPALLVPAAAFAGQLSGLFRRMMQAGTSLVCGVALGAAADPALARIGWHLSVDLSTVTAGWPLRRLFVTDLLGFQTTETLPHSQAAWVLSGAILLGVAACTWWLWRRRSFSELTAFAFVALATIIGSYLVVFWHEGVSYRQWKWISQFIPLFVGLVVAQALSALSLVRRRLIDGLSAAPTVGAGYLLAVTALAGSISFLAGSSRNLMVTADMASVAKNPQVRMLKSLNIDTNLNWDTMWLAYFLRDKQVYCLHESYFPVQKAGAEWSIERNDAPPTSTEVVRLNATYRLARHPSP